MFSKKFLYLGLYLLIGTSFHAGGRSVDSEKESVSGMPSLQASELPAWSKSSSSAAVVAPATSLPKLEQEFSNLLLDRLAEFAKPLVTALKPAVLDLLAGTSKQILKALIESQTVIDPEILKILEEPAKKLVELTSNLLPQLSSLSATSVDDFFSQLDGLKDDLIGHLKTLDLAPGTSADQVIKQVLSLLGSLDKTMQLFQGDIVTELKKRLVTIQEPLSAAASKLLAGLPPETVERLLEPLKKFQGDIEKGLRTELDSFRKVLVEKLPKTIIDKIKLNIEILINRIEGDPGILTQTLRQTVENFKDRSKILTRSLKDILNNKSELAQMRRDLDDVNSGLKDEAAQDIKPVVADLVEQLDTVQQMVTPVVSTDINVNATQVAQDANIPVTQRKPEQKNFFGGLFSRFKKIENEVSNVSRQAVEGIVGEKFVEPKPGDKPSPLFTELSEGTIIAIRSDRKSPGNGRYLSVDKNGMLKPTGTNKKDMSCQFTVVRFGNYLGLKTRTAGEKYMQCDPATGEIKFAGKDFYSDTAQWEHFFPVGNRIDKVYFKNRKTGGYLSVRKSSESWSQGGSVMARDGSGSPAKPTNWGRFAIEIVRHPDEPLAQNTQILDQLLPGTLVAIKSLKDLVNPRYLQVFLNPSKKDEMQYKYFVRATGNDKNDPACQFYVARKDNWLVLKTKGWRSLCAEPITHRVKFIDRTDTMASSIEHWELHPDKDGSLSSIWLQNRASRGYLTVPDGDWTKDLVWTAFARVKNPLAKQIKTAMPFIMEPAGRGDNGRFAIEIVKPRPDDVIGGGSTFSFIPTYHGKNEVQFHENWKFPAGNLELVLKNVQGEANFYINLSSTMAKSSTALRILLGRENNTSSSIRLGEDILFDQKDNDGAVVTASSAFWARLQDGVLSVGKGTEFGNRLIATVNVGKEKTENLTYVGLGGSIDPVFCSVEMNRAIEEKPVPAPPAPKPEEVPVAAPVKVEEPVVEPLAAPVTEPVVPEIREKETEVKLPAIVTPAPIAAPLATPVVRAQKRPVKKAKKPARKKPKKPARKKKKKVKKSKKSGVTTGKTFIQGSQGAHRDKDQAIRERRVRQRRKAAGKKRPAKKSAKRKKASKKSARKKRSARANSND